MVTTVITLQLENNCNNFNQEVREHIFDHTISYLQEQFKFLYESIDNLSIGKKAGEKLNTEMTFVKEVKI